MKTDEGKGSYTAESLEALEMLGKGYNGDPIPPTEFVSTMSGFTPAPDILVREYGFVTALVWGRTWRFCQMVDGVCRASLEKIGASLGMSERTIIRHLDTLCEGGYLLDTTPDLKNKPHIYADTGKIRIRVNVEAGMTLSQRRVTESQREGDRESVEESSKKANKKKNGADAPDLLEHELEIKRRHQLIIDATNAFEVALGVQGWPWESKTNWGRFTKWVTDTHGIDPTAFRDYSAWRENAGKYKAMSNTAIRRDPQVFMDTGWPTFLADTAMKNPPPPKIIRASEQPKQGISRSEAERRGLIKPIGAS